MPAAGTLAHAGPLLGQASPAPRGAAQSGCWGSEGSSCGIPAVKQLEQRNKEQRPPRLQDPSKMVRNLEHGLIMTFKSLKCFLKNTWIVQVK